MKDKEKQIDKNVKLEIVESVGFHYAYMNDMRISKGKPLSTSKNEMMLICSENYILEALGYAKDSVVLSKEEYEKYQNLKRDIEHSFEYNQGYVDGQVKGSKETAEKCIRLIKETYFTEEALCEFIAKQFGCEIKGE